MSQDKKGYQRLLYIFLCFHTFFPDLGLRKCDFKKNVQTVLYSFEKLFSEGRLAWITQSTIAGTHGKGNGWANCQTHQMSFPTLQLGVTPLRCQLGGLNHVIFFFFFLVWNCSAVYVQVTLLFWVSVSSWSKWGGGRNLFHGVQPYDGGEVTLWAVRYLMSVFTKWGRKNKSNKVIFRLPPFLSSLWLCPSPLLGSGKPVGLPAFCKWGKVPF